MWSPVCKKLMLAFSSTRFFVVHFVAKQYILQQVSEQINTNTMHSITHRQTDGQTDDRIMPIAYCVAVQNWWTTSTTTTTTNATAATSTNININF